MDIWQPTIFTLYFQELKTLPKIDSQDLGTSFYSYTTILTQVSMTACPTMVKLIRPFLHVTN